MKYIILLICFGFSNSALISNNQCPNRPLVPALDLKKFVGDWYAIKAMSNYHQHGFDCLHYTQTEIGLLETEMMLCEKLNGFEHCVKTKCIHDGEVGKFTAIENNNRELKILTYENEIFLIF